MRKHPSKFAKLFSRLAGWGVALSLVVGCNAVLTTSAHTSPTPLINGISIPVPPPSLKLAPKQSVDVDGALEEQELGVTIYLYEHVSESGYFVAAEDDGMFQIPSVDLDLTDNCIEVYAQSSDDADPSIGVFYRATIAADDQSVEVEKLPEPCVE